MFDVFYTGPKPNLFAFEKEATLEEASKLATTPYFWHIDGYNDYSKFNFNWKPAPWEAEFTHAWPSQWQESGETFLVPTGTVEHKWHWHPSIEQVNRKRSSQIFYMDFMNPESIRQLDVLKKQHPDIKSTRYVDNHLNVFKRIMNLATTEHVWIISSICDYSDFDFTWHPSQWQKEMIHCFSNVHSSEKRGDTFYIHVESFKRQMIDLEMLDWFNVINYISANNVIRFPAPVHYYNTDDLVEEVKNTTFETPYVLFTNNNSIQNYRANNCLWTKKDRTVEALSISNATVLIPRDIKSDLKTQIYDYPYLQAHENFNYYIDMPPDVIYISNGEPDEEKWYRNVRESIIFGARTKETANLNRLRWIKGINGRTAAYQAAAQASHTPWFIAVFAKLEVNNPDLWQWQPDYFQEPKHYIFNSKNILNGLEYGHQGAIAYSKRLVLETNNPGIDFTLSQPHTVVPILSGIAHFNQDPWMTWRTAFREVVKLKHFQATQPTVETEYRLKTWLNKAQGDNAEWCLRGAADAVEYYDFVNGDYSKLMFTFEWAWLKEYAAAKNYNF